MEPHLDEIAVLLLGDGGEQVRVAMRTPIGFDGNGDGAHKAAA
jgi:hypothetical protein